MLWYDKLKSTIWWLVDEQNGELLKSLGQEAGKQGKKLRKSLRQETGKQGRKLLELLDQENDGWE